MNKSYLRQKLNPIDVAKKVIPCHKLSHIHYDPCMKPSQRDYWIVRQQASDGCEHSFGDLFVRALLPLAEKQSYCTGTLPEDTSNITDIRYIVGDIYHSRVYGEFYLPCSKERKYPGQRDRIRIPVACFYITQK